MTILMCAQKLTDASLIYRTGPKIEKTKKQMDTLRRNGAGQEIMESVSALMSVCDYVCTSVCV